MKSTQPKSQLSLSVVTIAFNNLDEVIETIKSVQMQLESPMEHFIVDGSTNGEINEHLSQANYPFVKWLSEPDKGISDAFNKGVLKSKGDVIHLLNSGDRYYDENCISTSMSAFRADPNLCWTHGQYYQFVAGEWVCTGKAFNASKLWRGFGKTGHQTMFVKREMYEKHGLFSLEKKMAMDYDFLLRIRNEAFKYLARPIVYFAPDGVSNAKWQETFEEVSAAYKDRIGFTPKLWLAKFIQYSFYTLNKTWLFKVYLKYFRKK